MARQVFHKVTLVGQAALPEPLFGDKAVEGILDVPVVRGHDIVLELAVVLTLGIMPPVAMTGGGLERDVVVVGILVRPLVVQGQVDITLPHQVLDHRLGLDDLLDTREVDGFRRLAVDQRHLAVRCRFQGLGLLPRVAILLDQQFLITLQGLDLLPVHRDRPGVIGLDQQLAAIEQTDLAGQAIAVLQPDGIGQQRRRGAEYSKAQQGSG